MDCSKAEKTYREIDKSNLKKLKLSILKAAINYVHIRAEWEFLSLKEQSEQDSERTAVHNRFIDSCYILRRNQIQFNENNFWRIELGNDRKQIGDFACWLHAFIAIKHR